MSDKNIVDVLDTIEFDGTIYNKDELTPSVYFEYVKSMKNKLDNNEYELIIDNTLTMLNKAKITGQTNMAARLVHNLELCLKELNAAKDGFDIFVNRKDIEKYIESVENKSIKIIELKNYEREIPDNVIEKIEKANKHFDELYIVFTDYTMKETKKVAKHRRDKDPILFGAFLDKSSDNNIYVEDRLFFIADWVDDKCDLTLEEIARDIKDKDGKDITYKVSNPKDEKLVKDIIDSYNKPLEETNLKPVSIFDKIKKKVTRKIKAKL